jgi:hypothetical protein
VLLGQPLRAVIPYLLDPQLVTARRPSIPNLGMVDDAVRLADLRATVVIGTTPSGVPNRVNDLGCTIDDLIADEQPWPSKGRFQRHVTHVATDLRADGLISGRERGAIVSAAARSGIGS